jgi:endonuclease III
VAKRPKYHGALDDASLAKIYDTLAATISPKSDLEYDSPFELLVAVVLSAQATRSVWTD